MAPRRQNLSFSCQLAEGVTGLFLHFQDFPRVMFSRYDYLRVSFQRRFRTVEMVQQTSKIHKNNCIAWLDDNSLIQERFELLEAASTFYTSRRVTGLW